MINFKIEKQEIEIDDKIIKFDFPIYQTVFFKNFFYLLFDPNRDDKNYDQFFNVFFISTQEPVANQGGIYAGGSSSLQTQIFILKELMKLDYLISKKPIG